MRLFVKDKFAKVPTQNYVMGLSKLMYIHYEWHCVYDEISVAVSNMSEKSGNIKLLNIYLIHCSMKVVLSMLNALRLLMLILYIL